MFEKTPLYTGEEMGRAIKVSRDKTLVDAANACEIVRTAAKGARERLGAEKCIAAVILLAALGPMRRNKVVPGTRKAARKK